MGRRVIIEPLNYSGSFIWEIMHRRLRIQSLSQWRCHFLMSGGWGDDTAVQKTPKLGQ